MISAIVLITADVHRIPEVAQEISEIKGIAEVYSVTGDVDLIAVAKVARHEDFADVIADRLNKVEGYSTHAPTSRSARTPRTTSELPSHSASTSSSRSTDVW